MTSMAAAVVIPAVLSKTAGAAVPFFPGVLGDLARIGAVAAGFCAVL